MSYKTLVISAAFMFILDYFWINLFMGDLYLNHYKNILIVKNSSVTIRFFPAFLVYLIMLAAVFYFARNL